MVTKVSVPIATVPGTDQSPDQVVVTDEKVYTRRQADILETMNSLPEGAKIIEDAPESEEEPEAETTPDTEDPATPDDPDVESDEVSTGIEEPPVEEPIVDEEASKEYDEDGFKYGTLGADDYREAEDGTVYWKTKIDGIEEWLTKKAITDGYQLRKYSDQKLQEVAKREKELHALSGRHGVR